MKNTQKGFIVPLLIAIIAVLVVGGGVYVYEQKSQRAPGGLVIPQYAVSTSTESGSFSASPMSGTAPLAVRFANTIKSAGDMSIDYGDGTSCSTADPDGSEKCDLYVHTYVASGTYTAVLYRHLLTTELARVTISVTGKAISSTVSVPGMQQYTDSNFGFSFWYPNTWKVWPLAVTDSTPYTGGTIIKSLVVAPIQDSNNGIIVGEFVSLDKGINDNAGCGPADGCPASIRYYFDSNTHTWMLAEYGIDGNPQSNAIIRAKVDMNSMGGLHVLRGNARFGDDVIVPLSANHFLVIYNASAGTNRVRFLANTVIAADPLVATPVSSAQQVQTIQAEGTEYSSYKW